MNLIPDVPKNLSIEFFFKEKYMILSPIEKLKIYNKLKMVKISNQNSYKEMQEIEYETDKTYEPGFKFMYYDFINNTIFGKKTNYSIRLREMIQIQKLISILK